MTCSSQACSAIAALSPLRASRTTRAWRRSACSRSAKTSSVSIVSMSAAGSTRPSGWMTLSSPMAADDVQQRVGLADVGQELVAEALALVRAGDEPRDVVEVDRVRDDVRGLHGLGHRLEPRVVDRHHGDVRLDRRERVVRGLRPGAGERVEQRGLARVRHADDPDLHRPRLPTTAPERGAGRDVGRVVHAEVQARGAHRERGAVERAATAAGGRTRAPRRSSTSRATTGRRGRSAWPSGAGGPRPWAACGRRRA